MNTKIKMLRLRLRKESNRKLIVNSFKSIARRVELDKAVLFGLFSKMWSFVTGPITALIITSHFSAPLQGYYYTFAGLLALQTFMELGLGVVIVQFVSHEWSNLQLDEDGNVVGENDSLSRLASITRIALKWYVVASITCIFGLGIGGYLFFTGSKEEVSIWKMPWFSLCGFTGLIMCLVPIWSILEGCNQVAKLYSYRFILGIVTTLSTWIAMINGSKLWTGSVTGLVTLACAGIFIRRNYWNFFKSLILVRYTGPKFNWSKDILPMQSKIAISWICGYLSFSFFVPVLFKFRGPVVAGQMGLTWAFIAMIGAVSSSWIAPKIPRFGVLIAQKKYVELDLLFWRITKVALVITLIMGLLIWIAVYILNNFDIPYVSQLKLRLLSPLSTGIFVVAQVLQSSLTPFTWYLLAHKKNPIMIPSVLFGVLTAISTFFIGKYYSAEGVATGYLAVNLIVVPWVLLIWHRCIKTWHQN